MHFHWGGTAIEGSEHSIEDSKYTLYSIVKNNLINCSNLRLRMPLELHVLHFKKSYLNQTEALKHEDGIICVVYLFKVVFIFCFIFIQKTICFVDSIGAQCLNASDCIGIARHSNGRHGHKY